MRSGLKKIIMENLIPDGAAIIDKNAFNGCDRLTSIHIPKSVKDIGSGAFLDCKSLKSICIPDGITKIKNGTFYNCYSLESIHIPDKVTKIGESAFIHCKSLKSIHIPDSVAEIGWWAFDDCKNLTIQCNYNSSAEVYAKAHEIPVAHLNENSLATRIRDISKKMADLQSKLNECIALQSELNKYILDIATTKTEENNISTKPSKGKQKSMEYGDD